MADHLHDLHQERYKIDGKPVVVRMDHATGLIRIMSYGFDRSYPATQYENFTGDMREFAAAKIKKDRR